MTADNTKAALERLAAWMARGNPPGGMNVPDIYTGTPSIQADLRLLLASHERMEKALRPFAALAEHFQLFPDPDLTASEDVIEVEVSRRDAFEARAALEAQP